MVHNSTNHLNSLNKKRTTTYDVVNPVPSLGKAHKCGGVYRLMGSQPSPLDNWISTSNTYYKQAIRKTCTDSLPIKKTTHYHKYKWQH